MPNDALGRLVRRLGYWWRLRAQQAELREEIETHRAMLVAELERRGLSADAANAEARRVMGNETIMREDARGVWLSIRTDSLVSDLRYAWRGLRRAPAFSALVIMVLALTIAANTTMFSVVQHVLLNPLPFPGGNRIVRLGAESIADPLAGDFGIRAELFHRLLAGSRTLDEIAAVSKKQVSVGRDAEQEPVAGALVTPAFMSMLRVQPALGRAFGADDARAGAPPVVILSQALWQGRFAGANDVVGKVIHVAGTQRTIIGVMPNGFDLPMSLDEPVELWLPLDAPSVTNGVVGYARLRQGATSASATRELEALAKDLPTTKSQDGYRLRATTAQERLDPRDRRAVELLFATVCGLLLIACANIANLLLMRSWTRHRELAVRVALGASRWRVARQLLIESVMLASIGGALGVMLAWQGLGALTAIYPGGLLSGALATLDGVRIDATVLAWTVAVSVGTGLLTGVGPAILARDTSLGDALRRSGRTAVGGRGARSLCSVFIVAELALSLTFLAAGALLVRSFAALANARIGLEPAGLVTVSVRLAHQPAPADRATIEQTLLQTIRAVPGARDVAFGGGLAMTDVQGGPFAVEGPTGLQVMDLPFCEMPFVSADYFRTSGIALVRGRTIDPGAAGAREIVVGESVARRFWPNDNALGARLRIGEGPSAEWMTVAGIVNDVRLPGATGDLFNLQMYRSTRSADHFVGNLVVRMVGEPTAIESLLRRSIENAGVSATVNSVWFTEQVVERRVLARPRFALVVFVGFALLALAVSAAGLYGVIAYAVTQRTREIGVRVALGAAPSAVARLVVGDSAKLLIVGGIAGLAGAYGATRLLARFLYQISPMDAIALGGAILVLVGVALVATLVPVRRALKIDPLDALRTD